MEPRLNSFAEFWPFYLSEHSLPSTRQWHFLGTSMALTCVLIYLIFGYKWMFVLAPLFGYGAAWFAHFNVEKNRPATFTYPWWSLVADLKLFGIMLTGRIDSELDKYGIEPRIH